MPVEIACIIGGILALAATILACIFILPEKKRPSLNKFFRFVADIFNFKTLFIEKILKFLYIFATLYCIAAGFFMLFSGTYTPSSFWGSGSTFHSTALVGLLTMILGPISVRIFYELLMLIIIIAQNVISINKKIPGNAEAKPQEPAASQETPAPKMVYCTHCGTQYDANKGGCPNGCQDE